MEKDVKFTLWTVKLIYDFKSKGKKDAVSLYLQ